MVSTQGDIEFSELLGGASQSVVRSDCLDCQGVTQKNNQGVAVEPKISSQKKAQQKLSRSG
ncbi:hypothetical protein MAN88_13250 [Microcystis aeruginosa]|nr:hypothetical protein MAN88_13250 [Microcystis aeruginosa]